ncbi:hypothetical protein GX411_09820 [Candidatus Fermentibacteria bacterium]|nr:hypothetical protein [Candidatus Fermentibacteria bacterium]
MKNHLLLSIPLALIPLATHAQGPDYSAPGPWGYDSLFCDIPGDGEIMTSSIVYFPWEAGSVPPAAGQCPVVAFGHGWNLSIDHYYSYCRHFASWGYVVVLPTISNPLFNPEHDRRANCLVMSARYASSLGGQSGHVLENRIDRDNWSLVGHSMGGSLSILAADLFGPGLGDTLRAAVSYSGPQSDPECSGAGVLVPKLILEGTEDGIVPWEDVQSQVWADMPAPGAFAVIDGASHCYFMDYSTWLEELFDGDPTISRAAQQEIARLYTTALLERFQHDDTSEWNFQFCYGDSLENDPAMYLVDIRWEPSGCTPDESCSALRVLPNPFSVSCEILGEPGSAVIVDLTGRVVASLSIPGQWTPGIELSSGVYCVVPRNGRPAARLMIVR